MAKKKSAIPQTITLDQFRSWLQGVEDMQTEDWAPNADQWKVIREKIDLIVLREELTAQTTTAPFPSYGGGYQPPVPSYMPPLPPIIRPQLETAVIMDNTGQQTTIAVQPASTRSEFE